MSAIPDVFDFDANGFVDEFTYTVLDLQGKPTALQIVFAGPGHPVTIAAEETQLRETIERNTKWQQEAKALVEQNKPAPAQQLTVADFRMNKAKEVAARILRSGKFRFNGEVVELGTKSAEILANPKIFDWLTGPQLVTALGKKENFMKSCV